MKTHKLRQALATEAWAITPAAFDDLHRLAATVDSSIPSVKADTRVEQQYTPTGEQIAVITLHGSIITRAPGWLTSYYDASSPQRFAQLLRGLANNPAISTVVVWVDSPGGTVAGTVDAAEAVAYARSKKPVIAVASDSACSAAYWVACQATQVVVTPTAIVGSIGVITTHLDYSGMYKEWGVVPTVVRSAPQKALGQRSEPLTGKALEDWQALVDSLHTQFVTAVASGRRRPLATVQAWATGQVWVGAEAVSAGLADRVATLGTVLAELTGDAVPNLPADDNFDEGEDEGFDARTQTQRISTAITDLAAAFDVGPSAALTALEQGMAVIQPTAMNAAPFALLQKAATRLGGHQLSVPEAARLQAARAVLGVDLPVSPAAPPTSSVLNSVALTPKTLIVAYDTPPEDPMNIAALTAKLVKGEALTSPESAFLAGHLAGTTVTTAPSASAQAPDSTADTPSATNTTASQPDTSNWPPEARAAFSSLSARLDATEQRATTAENAANAERDIRLTAHFEARAAALGQPKEFATTLRAASAALSPEQYAQYEAALERGAQATGQLLNEHGSGTANASNGGDVNADLDQRARALMAQSAGLSYADAQKQVLGSDAGLRARYNAQFGRR